MQTHSILPKRVLVVEDEAVIAFDVEDALRGAGFTPVGPALTLPEALRLMAAADIDVAIVDVGMITGSGRGLVQALIARAIPFLFLTGYGSLELPADLPAVDTVLKPFHTPDLLQSLSELLEVDGTTTRQRPEAAEQRVEGN
jgi:DNA-binding NtrC family response regulator